MQKEDWKNVGFSQSYDKKSDFDPPFWIAPSFLTHLTKNALDSLCWLKYKRIVEDRTEKYWKMLKFCHFEFRPAFWTSDAILNLTKNFCSVKYFWLKYNLKSLNRTQKSSKHTELWLKILIFSHFENHRHFENLWKELPNFFQCLCSYSDKMWQKIKIFKNTLFDLMSFFCNEFALGSSTWLEITSYQSNMVVDPRWRV
jgi:hypothetical protein